MGKREKIVLNGVDVSILNTREMHFNKDGKLITVNLQDYSKEILQSKFHSLEEFLNVWNAADRKEVWKTELAEQGLSVEALLNAVNRDCDLFDIFQLQVI